LRPPGDERFRRAGSAQRRGAAPLLNGKRGVSSDSAAAVALLATDRPV
jgi:hypothetical protein